MDIEQKLPKIQENISLAGHTTFKIGGPARWFFIAKNTEEIKKAISMAKELNLDSFILGGGSNVLVSDKGFNGLIIKIKNSKFKIQNSKIIYAEAGMNLGKLVEYSVSKGLTGLEWAAGIPGTIGGAICGNTGAFGKSISEVVTEAQVLVCDKKNNIKVKKYNNKDCKFAYRDSILKRNKNLIIVVAKIQLEKGDKEKSQQMISEYLGQRRESQPLEYPSAGSVFKNLKFEIENLKLLNKYPQLKRFSKHGMIPAGWLIEECGLAGKKIGSAMVSEKHANFIVNLGKAKAEDVVILISLIKQKIRNKFGIQLQEEIEYIGF